ncbi:TPA: 50S ribosomal protein L21e [archaeon]|uniref:Large ribosomal subunit protein eL21 n=1 Tax=Candidatus Naiadarchaeum limnaeum TaxID=2756139 RepID=A0A832V4L7_9ARCH|nr:50S ribosomal protein L21e [Candidatus Naiadarchaeales archaeon SRR2090153.bin1042]HIK00822.1 50S ribosomal protein L21e [Candidatus Naiadarchaeum limnaeum]
MVRHSKGFRARTRKKLTGGEFSIADALQEFKLDEKVVIDLNAAVHKGMPHPRFQGQIGRVVEKRGRAFVVEFMDHEKKKQIIAKAEHLKRF